MPLKYSKNQLSWKINNTHRCILHKERVKVDKREATIIHKLQHNYCNFNHSDTLAHQQHRELSKYAKKHPWQIVKKKPSAKKSPANKAIIHTLQQSGKEKWNGECLVHQAYMPEHKTFSKITRKLYDSVHSYRSSYSTGHNQAKLSCQNTCHTRIIFLRLFCCWRVAYVWFGGLHATNWSRLELRESRSETPGPRGTTGWGEGD